MKPPHGAKKGDPAIGLVRVVRYEGSEWCEIRTGPWCADWDGIPDRPKDQREVIRACIRYAVERALSRRARGEGRRSK